jgi:hypothetical protein
LAPFSPFLSSFRSRKAPRKDGCNLSVMGASPQDDTPATPDIDENGVDRAQIRAMLRLTPEERLRFVEEFVESALVIRELNAPRPVR